MRVRKKEKERRSKFDLYNPFNKRAFFFTPVCFFLFFLKLSHSFCLIFDFIIYIHLIPRLFLVFIYLFYSYNCVFFHYSTTKRVWQSSCTRSQSLCDMREINSEQGPHVQKRQNSKKNKQTNKQRKTANIKMNKN